MSIAVAIMTQRGNQARLRTPPAKLTGSCFNARRGICGRGRYGPVIPNISKGRDFLRVGAPPADLAPPSFHTPVRAIGPAFYFPLAPVITKWGYALRIRMSTMVAPSYLPTIVCAVGPAFYLPATPTMPVVITVMPGSIPTTISTSTIRSAAVKDIA